MAPLVCLVVAFLLFRGLGIFVPYFANGVTALCAALGAMFLLSASAHWGNRRSDLIRMVPRGIGIGGLWVSLTGIAEIAIAIGFQIPHLFRSTAGRHTDALLPLSRQRQGSPRASRPPPEPRPARLPPSSSSCSFSPP